MQTVSAADIINVDGNYTKERDIRELILVEKNIVMGWPTSTKQTAVTLEIKVKLDGVDDVAIDNCPRRAVPTSISLICRLWEEANMVSLANYDKRDGGFDT